MRLWYPANRRTQQTDVLLLLNCSPITQACVSLEEQYARVSAFVKELQSMPVAISTDKANEQHYEVWVCAV